MRKRKERGLHPLVRNFNTRVVMRRTRVKMEIDWMEVERINAVAGIKVSTGNRDDVLKLHADFDTEAGSNLNPLLEQLQSHLLSMRNNTASMHPLLAAMDDAQIALKNFAARNLDEGLFEPDLLCGGIGVPL